MKFKDHIRQLEKNIDEYFENVSDEQLKEDLKNAGYVFESKDIKVYLDDMRTPPKGWTLVRWPDEVIALLKKGNVTEISLDHDLGDDKRGTGYDVLTWIEKEVVLRDYVPPKINIHTANISAGKKMRSALKSIQSRL